MPCADLQITTPGKRCGLFLMTWQSMTHADDAQQFPPNLPPLLPPLQRRPPRSKHPHPPGQQPSAQRRGTDLTQSQPVLRSSARPSPRHPLAEASAEACHATPVVPGCAASPASYE
jgi:hypothetical protein